MAAIGKIRENSTFLLIVIGGAMVAFILGDLFSGGGPTPQEQYVGEVYGEEIDMVQYEQRVQEQIQSRQVTGQPLNEQARNSIRNQVWNNMVMERIMYNQLNELGMRITQEEYDDIRFGENIQESFKNNPTFQNPQTGQFDPNRVRQYFQMVQQDYPTFHRVQQNQLVNSRLYEKYNNLVKKGMHANPVDARDSYMRKNTKVNFDFVVKKFGSVADSTLDISEDEMREYFDEHSEEDRFQVDASSSIDYAVFDVKATENDRQVALEELAQYKEDFASAEDDSTFIARNSETMRYKPFQYKGGVSAEVDSMFANAQEGEVIGPYIDGSYVKIAKVTGFEEEDQARVRHILLKTSGGQTIEDLKDRADSLKQVVKSQDNFPEMVQQFSEDPGSKQNDGVYDWFGRERMVKPFTEAAFKSEGSISVVETQYGVHLVEVLGRRTQNVPMILTVEQTIEPTSDTFDNIYDIASGISINSDNAEEFRKNVEEAGYEIKTKESLKQNAQSIPGVAGSRQVVRWANNPETELGSVSEPFEAGNKFVVATVTDRRDAGTAEFEDVRETVMREVAREKKAGMFKEQMKGSDLESIAETVDAEVKSALNISGTSTTLPGGLNEPYIAGVATTLEEGQVSVPLKGENGVYVVKITKKSPAEEQEDYSFARSDVEKNLTNRVTTINGATYRALKDLAGVKDERGKVY